VKIEEVLGVKGENTGILRARCDWQNIPFLGLWVEFFCWEAKRTLMG